MLAPKKNTPRRALLDSQFLIAFLRGNPLAFELFWMIQERYTAVAVIGELATGLHRAKNLNKALKEFTHLCNLITVLPATQEIAICYGRLQAKLFSKGQPIPSNDVWIAATAETHRLPILSNDAHFLRLSEIQTIGW